MIQAKYLYPAERPYQARTVFDAPEQNDTSKKPAPKKRRK
jgi:hypothetical protein